MNDGSWGELKVIRKGSQDTPNTYYFLEVINSNAGSFQPCEIIDYVYHKSNQQPFGSQASTKSRATAARATDELTSGTGQTQIHNLGQTALYALTFLIYQFRHVSLT